eukprot:s200_g29.t1
MLCALPQLVRHTRALHADTFRLELRLCILILTFTGFLRQMRRMLHQILTWRLFVFAFGCFLMADVASGRRWKLTPGFEEHGRWRSNGSSPVWSFHRAENFFDAQESCSVCSENLN